MKVDQDKEEKENDVQLMKPLTNLDYILSEAKRQNVFGVKIHSVIYGANKDGIKDIVSQQFKYGKKIYDAGFIPLLEIEIDNYSENKAESEKILKTEIMKHLKFLDEEVFMFRVSIPAKPNFYKAVTENPNVLGVVALLEGYTQEDAVNKLANNDNMIAGFSKALLKNLHVDQDDEKFHSVLKAAAEKIYQISLSYVLYLHPIATTQLIPITNKL